MSVTKFVWLVLAITLTISGCVKYEKHETTAQDILKKALKRYNTSYEVTIVNYVKGKSNPTIKHGIFKGSKFKIVGNNSTMVSNGSVMWIYWNVTKQLVINDFSKSDEKPEDVFTRTFLDLLNNCELNLRITPDYYIVNCSGKMKQIKSKTVWIDKKTLMPLKVELNYKFNGLNLTYVTEYKNLKLSKFKDSIFNVAPPKAQTVVRIFYFQKIEDAQKIVNFTIIQPSNTGCKLKGINVFEQGDRENVMLIYQGRCFLTVFEIPMHEMTHEMTEGAERIDISGVQAWYKEWNFSREVKFEIDNMVFKIVSDCLSKQKLIVVAKSIINQKSKLPSY